MEVSPRQSPNARSPMQTTLSGIETETSIVQALRNAPPAMPKVPSLKFNLVSAGIPPLYS